MQSRKTLPQLFFPIALESLFMILTGTVDTMMLASVSDAAVGAVGTANSYLSIFIIMLAVISSGLVSVVTQYIGAERRTAAGQTLHLGLCFNALLAMALDECVRAVFLRCRWRSEKWQSKGILYRKETTA